MALHLKSEVYRFYSELWYFHLKFKAGDVRELTQGKDRRVACTINETLTIQAALMPDGHGDFFINLNKEVRKKLKLVEGDMVDVILQKDESKYGIEVCEEFLAALEMDPVASDHFHALTKGKQRSLIYLATKPKRSETRIQKSMVILDFLKINNGKLDFKLLNEAFKASR